MILLLSSRMPEEQEMYQNLTIPPGYADSNTFTTTPLIPGYNTTTHSFTSFAGNLQIGKCQIKRMSNIKASFMKMLPNE